MRSVYISHLNSIDHLCLFSLLLEREREREKRETEISGFFFRTPYSPFFLHCTRIQRLFLIVFTSMYEMSRFEDASKSTRAIRSAIKHTDTDLVMTSCRNSLFHLPVTSKSYTFILTYILSIQNALNHG